MTSQPIRCELHVNTIQRINNKMGIFVEINQKKKDQMKRWPFIYAYWISITSLFFYYLDKVTVDLKFYFSTKLHNILINLLFVGSLVWNAFKMNNMECTQRQGNRPDRLNTEKLHTSTRTHNDDGQHYWTKSLFYGTFQHNMYVCRSSIYSCAMTNSNNSRQ